ncbi:MAG: ferritin-like domain-containing protein [Frankia sp.]|nr:ferritin-like domain-containing protein [Frankia sp.]
MPSADTIENSHSFDVFQHYERLQWKLVDLPLGEIRADLVRPEHVALAKSAVMGESTSIAAVHGFLNEFADDYDFSAFVNIWGYQELQHHYAFRAWLRALDIHIDPRRIEVLREPYAPGTTPSATLITNVISELTVNTVYRTMADRVAEPVLAELMLRASRDEAGHAREFMYFAKRRLERNPHELPSALETCHFYLSNDRIRHPVGEFKHRLLEELRGHETIDTAFEVFLSVAEPDALDRLRDKIRRALGNVFGREFATNADIRHALAEALT